MPTFPTPNVPSEQLTKQTIRANNGGGSNSYWSNPQPDPVTVINAAVSGTLPNLSLYRLTVSGAANTTFVISGSQFVATGLTGNTTVSGFIGTVAGVLPSGYSLTVWNKTADYLGSQATNGIGLGTLDFIISAPVGTTLSALTITSGNSATLPAQINEVAISTTAESTAYPTYVNFPYSTPNWTSDAVVHAYPIYGFGNTTQDTSKTVEVQVRQLNTGTIDGGSETQIWSGYYAAYQSNLNQTKQKNTKQQQC